MAARVCARLAVGMRARTAVGSHGRMLAPQYARSLGTDASKAVSGSSYNDKINVSTTVYHRTSKPKPRVAKESLTFGSVFTDHMAFVDWDDAAGWHAPVITHDHNISLHAAASVLHYGLECFEGMKAYKDDEGGVRLFRPDLNMARMHTSMTTFAMPPLDKAGALDLISALVKEDAGWIPTGDGYSLYLRPTVISTYAHVGVARSRAIKLFVLACPVGPYYASGFKPVSLLVDTTHARAWPGGVGFAKVGGNYAPSIRVQAEAAAAGFSQILWTYLNPSTQQHELTEVGTMNLFVALRGKGASGGEVELITPPLDGTILPGVTRTSIMELARGWSGVTVSERVISMQEVMAASAEGRLVEAFGAGTAAVVSPIKSMSFKGVEYKIPCGEGAGPLASRAWKELTDIQYGRVKNHPWSVRIA